MSELKAGRELDALVAEKVMGQSLESLCVWFRANRCDGKHMTRCGACGAEGHGNCYGHGDRPMQVPCDVSCDAPAFSEDIKAAWLVVEKMRERGHDCDVIAHWGYGDQPWSARFPGGDKGGHDSVIGETAPLAICRAALKAVDAA